MSDPFNILGSEPDAPPSFEQAVRDALSRLEATSARFDELQAAVPAARYTEDEWRVIESAAAELEEAVERAEEGYVAVMYDSHAWYRIMEGLQRITLRLESAIGIMELARDRDAG